MSAIAYVANIEMHMETCCNKECGVSFGIPSDLYKRLKATGNWFYCPNGHSQHYTETTEQKLRREIEKEVQRRQWAESSRDDAQKRAQRAERRTAAFKGVVTKVKRRVGNGVCPCCTRSFSNLQRHMKSKHPHFKGGVGDRKNVD